MRFSQIIAALIVPSAVAFVPSTGPVSDTALRMTVDRREAFGEIVTAAVGIAAFPALSSADGAVSSATVNRARGIYGSRVAALKDAVAKGDFAAVAAEKNAFVLFNSGAYPGAKTKEDKAKAIAQVNDIFAAIRSQDKGALKTAYDKYVADNGINPLPSIDNTQGQGFSSDYDFRMRTSAGAIYQR